VLNNGRRRKNWEYFQAKSFHGLDAGRGRCPLAPLGWKRLPMQIKLPTFHLKVT
jgi:hypothetical protein